jgi:hypothetical protein
MEVIIGMKTHNVKKCYNVAFSFSLLAHSTVVNDGRRNKRSVINIVLNFSL